MSPQECNFSHEMHVFFYCRTNERLHGNAGSCARAGHVRNSNCVDACRSIESEHVMSAETRNLLGTEDVDHLSVCASSRTTGTSRPREAREVLLMALARKRFMGLYLCRVRFYGKVTRLIIWRFFLRVFQYVIQVTDATNLSALGSESDGSCEPEWTDFIE